MPEARQQTEAERKHDDSSTFPWRKLGAAIKDAMDKGLGRQPRRRWTVKELINEGKWTISDSGVRQWLRGETRPDEQKFKRLIAILSRGENESEASELASRLWPVYDRRDEAGAAAAPLSASATTELRATAERLLNCVQAWRREEQHPPCDALQDNLDDYCHIMGSVAEEEAEAGIDRLARMQHKLDVQVLPNLSDKAQRCFEVLPIGGIASLLRRLSATVAQAEASGSSGDHRVTGDALTGEAYLELRRQLREEIAKLLVMLEPPRPEWPPRTVATAKADLRELRSILRLEPMDLQELEAARGRLEAIRREVAILDRAIVLTRRVLGCHVDKLPPLAVFEERLKDGTFGPELVVIPAGSFLMGSPSDEEERDDDEGPQHLVNVPRFALGRYAVTFEEYDRYCVAKGVKRPGDEVWGRGRRPVINVSWNDAQGYCAWLSSETGKVYRLPSEAEWEYACRAGTVSRYSWGDEFDKRLANNNREKTTEVGGYPANPWKLFDMHGNVWEWCEDDWHGSYDQHPGDGRPLVDKPRNARRVVRGGSWIIGPRNLRAADRYRYEPGDRNNAFGFRAARMLTP